MLVCSYNEGTDVVVIGEVLPSDPFGNCPRFTQADLPIIRYDRLVECSWIGDDARDELSDSRHRRVDRLLLLVARVALVRNKGVRCRVQRREHDVKPGPNFDEGIPKTELFDVVADP